MKVDDKLEFLNSMNPEEYAFLWALACSDSARREGGERLSDLIAFHIRFGLEIYDIDIVDMLLKQGGERVNGLWSSLMKNKERLIASGKVIKKGDNQ